MARLFVAIGGLIVLVLTVALVAPHFVDWTSYRADFEREAGRILGREVTVRGSASARLLPFPSVTFTDVAVAGVSPEDTAMTVETFSMDAELAPFMRGDIHIFDMRLVRPRVTVDLAADGALDWAVRPSVPVGASHISLEKLTVTEGRVELRHAASGRVHQLTEVNADISARALTGPWRMDGSLRLDGMKMALQVSTGQASDEGGMRLRVQARPERYPFALESDGNARIEDGRARYAGTFRLNAPVASEPAAAGARQGPPAYRLSGAFDLDHAALAVPEFRFETGSVEEPYAAEGSARFDLGAAPRFLVRADGAQIRFDDALAENAGGVGLRERLSSLHETLLDMPRPTIPGRIEMALPAVVAGDTTVRDVHLYAEPSETGWTIASLGATLPGRTTFEARGDLAVGEELGFDGSLLVAVGQPSGFAAWLARDVDDAIRRLPSAGFSADVALTSERQTFSGLELILGAAKFRGEIDSRTPAQARPSVSLRFDGDELDVEGMAAFASLFVSDSGETRLADRDVALEIVAGPVSAAGLTAETLDTALRLKDGRLEIDRLLVGGLAGANVSATGTLADLSGRMSGTLDASVIADDLEPLAAALAARFPDNRLAREALRRVDAYPGLYRDANVGVVASLAGEGGAATGLALTAQGTLGGADMALTVRMPDGLSAPGDGPLQLDLSLRGEEASGIYALLGVPTLPLDFAGAAEAKMTFDGVPETGGRTTFSLSGEGLSLVFSGDAAFAAAGFSANGAASLEADDLEPWLTTAGMALPGMGLGLPASLSAGLDFEGGLLVLSGLEGEVAESALSGDLNAELRDGLPHVTGALTLGFLDLAPVAELATGAAALMAQDEGWPSAPFASAMAAPLTGEIELSAERLSAGTFAEARDGRLTLRIARDGVSLADMRAAIFGGTASGIVDFRNDGGTGLLSAQLRIDGADARALLGDAGVDGRADLSASLTASGKSVDGVVAALAGSGTASVSGLAVSGVAPQVFPALIARADEIGPGIDAAATEAFAAPLVRQGRFTAEGVELAFTVANGVVRAPPFRLQDHGAALAGEVRADLAARTVGADATLTWDPGQEALAGSEPAVRFSAEGAPGAIRVSVDTEPLAQFLTQRALELEQQRVEAMQAGLIEKQRLRREVRYYAALASGRELAVEEARRAAEEAQRIKEERRRADEERRRLEEESERQRIEDETRRSEAEEAQRRQAAEEAARDEAERRRIADDRLRAEVEALLGARENNAPAASDGGTPDNRAMDAPPALPVAPDVMTVTPSPAPRGAPIDLVVPATPGGSAAAPSSGEPATGEAQTAPATMGIADFLREIGVAR